MGFNDYQRGDREGYQSTPTRPAKGLEEAMGRAAGQERRNQDFLRDHKASGEYESLPPRFGLYAIVLIGLFVGAKWFFDASTGAALLLAVTIAALLITRSMRRLLRSFTPIYVGLLGGTALGSLSLVMSGAPLNLGNIAVHVILGAALGISVTLVSRRRARQRPHARK